MLLRIFTLFTILFFVYSSCFGMTVLYKNDEEVFQNTTEVMKMGFPSLHKVPISKNKEIIISSTSDDNYSFNPEIMEKYRTSLLSFTFFVFFTKEKTQKQIENYFDIDIDSFNPLLASLVGVRGILQSIKEEHFSLYVYFAKKEIDQLIYATRNFKYPFKGFSTIEYSIK